MAIFLAVPFCGKKEKRKASSGIWENNKVLVNNAGSSKNFFIVECLALQEKDLKSIKMIKWFQSIPNELPATS
jgi:ribosomal protein L37AE/L43A